MREYAAVASIVVVLLLAGCGGVAGPSDETPSTSEPDARTADTSTGSVDEWEAFAFSEGEFYRFSFRSEVNDVDSELTWEVLAVEEGTATVNISYTNGTHSFSTTVVGDRSTLVQKVLNSGETVTERQLAARAGQQLMAGPLNAMVYYLDSRELAVGESWEVSGSEQSGYLTANVEKKSQYAGEECFLTSFSAPEDSTSSVSRFDVCIAPEVGLSLHTAYYGDSPDQPDLVVTLEEYHR